MALCNKNFAMCCSVISVWGVIQLILMGGFYMSHSLALIEDLPEVERNSSSLDQYYNEIVDAYDENAKNCWLAAGCYAITLLICLSQLYLHKRATYQAS